MPDIALSHPPGLNRFQTSEQQLRENLLGPHSTRLHRNTPGLLNLGPTHRNVHPGFEAQGEAEKQQQRVSFAIYSRRSVYLGALTMVSVALIFAETSANPIHQLQPPTNTALCLKINRQSQSRIRQHLQ
jgi:hypothetical protein